MIALYLEALAAIALSLPILMAGVWIVQQRTGNYGWLEPRTSIFLPLPPHKGVVT
jgi:steroid 5-alpha reductase family enzyme